MNPQTYFSNISQSIWLIAGCFLIILYGCGDHNQSVTGSGSEELPSRQLASSKSVASSELPVEVGSISELTHKWKRVKFQKSYSNPVVIAKTSSGNGQDPFVVRMDDVNTSGFAIRVQEWDYLNDIHGQSESLDYLVVEGGRHSAGGLTIEAGYANTDHTDKFDQVDFSQGFAEPPVVLTSVMSTNGGQAVTTRVNEVTARGFSVMLQEQEANKTFHKTEKVGYVALPQGQGQLADFGYEVKMSPTDVDHNFTSIPFSKDHIESEDIFFLADMQAMRGEDPATLTTRNLTSSGVQIKVTEEQSLDSKTGHRDEPVGYLALSVSGDGGDQADPAPDPDPRSLSDFPIII